jgi:class 3 adenylate cyclase
MPVCVRCGQENRAGARFCDACGVALAEATPRDERKILSVLFADLVGSTSTAERMDPEDVRALQDSYWRHVRSELERYGGTVEKFIGDAVVALFGAPTAHEDDPERAVRAGLAIRDWAREHDSIQVRIGITTGEALVRLGAQPLAGEGMASGDVVNTASRLQTAAPANAVLVDDQTRRATRDTIDYADAEPLVAKGKAQPISVWEAVQARSRLGVDVVQHARIPLVGRDRELDVLKDALARVREDRSPQLVTLVGVPGIGKSRLVYELMRAVAADKDIVIWRQGRSLPYGDGVSFWALAEIVKAQIGILETDADADARPKLAQAVHGLFDSAAEADWVERHLRPLVGLAGEGEPSTDRSETFAAWRQFFEVLADWRPSVLVFEDLHWADDGLLDFVDSLSEWVKNVPLLVVATARTELLERRPTWAGGKANATTLSLSPLSGEETARLVRRLVEDTNVTAEMEQKLVEDAGGNALYAEQYARMWQEREHAEQLRPPDTVHGIIAARLDALSTTEKTLLQNAAVFGKVFWEGAVVALNGVDRHVVDRCLHALERKEFIQRARRSSVEDESEYAFRHMLVRDVAYGQIPRAARADKHERAAAWIESLARAEDQSEMIAHHYLTALELTHRAAEGDEVLAGEALRALIQAGDRASAVNASSSAARYYHQALELLPPGDEGRPQLLFAYACALFEGGDDKRIEALEDAAGALRVAGDLEGAAETHAMLAEVGWIRGEHDRENEHLQQALALLQERQDSSAKARVLAAAARFAMIADAANAVDLARDALALAERLGLDELTAQTLITLGTARWRLGDIGGEADLIRGLELALANGSLNAAFRGYNNLAMVIASRGQPEKRVEFLKEAERLGLRLGDPEQLKFVQAQLINAIWRRGQWDEALERANRFIAECEAGSPHVQESWLRLMRAGIRIARDDEQGALEDIDVGLALGRKGETPESFLVALAYAIQNYVTLGRLDEARALAEEGRSYDPAVAANYLLDVFALHKDTLGFAYDELEPYFAYLNPDFRGAQWCRLIVDGDFAQVADLVADSGIRQMEAEFRMRAAKDLMQAGAGAAAAAQADKALAFYREVRATRYVREAEALLAAATDATQAKGVEPATGG